MSAIAEKFGSTIDGFIGDAIAFFGDPKAQATWDAKIASTWRSNADAD